VSEPGWGAAPPARPTTVRDGRPVTLRALRTEDADRFGAFLESLDDSTRSLFNPHLLTAAEAARISARVGADDTLRLLVTADRDADAVVGYVLLDRAFSADERSRYASYGIQLISADRRIAPVVADSYRGAGLGAALLGWTAEVLTGRGVRQLILFGGTQARNAAAVRLYQKIGFRELGRFVEKGRDSVDMHLLLGAA
jgi:GNAT superfamily N-acetyltransferase